MADDGLNDVVPNVLASELPFEELSRSKLSAASSSVATWRNGDTSRKKGIDATSAPLPTRQQMHPKTARSTGRRSIPSAFSDGWASGAHRFPNLHMFGLQLSGSSTSLALCGPRRDRGEGHVAIAA